MTAASTVGRVIAIVSRLAGADRTPQDAGAHTPLGSGGFQLTSVGVLEMIVACETEFGVAFDAEEDFTRETLATVGSLAAAIETKRAR